MKKMTKIFLVISITSFLLIGVINSIKREAEIKDFINDMSSTTKQMVSINGENPNLESVQEAQKFLEKKKPELIQKYRKLIGKEFISDESDLGKRLKESRDHSQTLLADSFAQYIKNAYEIQKQINDLNGRLTATGDKENSSRNDIKDLISNIESKYQILEKRILVIKEFDKLAEDLKSIY